MMMEYIALLEKNAERIIKNARKLYEIFEDRLQEIRQFVDRAGTDIGMFPEETLVSGKRAESLMLRVERLLWECCDALSSYYRYAELPLPQGNSALINDSGAAPDELVSLWQYPDIVIVRTPYLRRRMRGDRAMMACACVFERLKYRLYSVDGDLFSANKVFMYVLNVYKTEFPLYAVLDPDNINFKVAGDIVMQKLGIDDSGANESLIVHTVFKDDLPPGTYTIVAPAGDAILTGEALYQFVKKHILAEQNGAEKS